MSVRQFNSKADKRHYIDPSCTEGMEIEDYAWMANYNQRALLVRVLCNLEDTQCSRSQDNTIESVKFFTREKDQSQASEVVYDCHDSFDQRPLDNFYEKINSFLEPFEQSDITSQYWKDIVRCLELYDFKYEKVDKVEMWLPKKNPMSDKDLEEAYAKMSTEQRKYVSSFKTALQTDMNNGRAENWIEVLMKILLTCLGSDDMCGSATNRHDSINTALETVFGDLDTSFTQIEYNAPYSSTPSSTSSSLSSLSSLNLESSETESSPGCIEEHRVSRHTIVPDYCVVLPNFPGIFPIVFELKPAHRESHAIFQNIQQMLSKLFFQDVVFGVVVSPRLFQLSVIIKQGKDLHFASTNSIYIYKNKNQVKTLDLGELNKMYTFIYRVLKWSRKTKCLLKSRDRYEGKEESCNGKG
ncbi:unnamed protein product [Mytilus coruscus]|uniref:Uncharacterized protein n=1 Tax=Mytilus coruscus TaxID=42192 RepID=A0A6J8A0R4_MYTCO|nr:unnamed protein product [Mytilus coruscus]